jgi:hemerythrin-like domain-containing protein
LLDRRSAVIHLPETSRRRLIGGLSGALLAAGVSGTAFAAKQPKETKPPPPEKEKKVGAVEDLMREHGVLRRALLVYRQSAARLRAGAAIDPKSIRQAAQLFRDFGENYHERMLEQAYIFPALRKSQSPAGALVATLIAQHDRGREVTDYIRAATSKGKIADAEALAGAFETFDLMYENHAAREDTIVFPAWKEGLSERQLREMGETFEDIEHRQFGKDGFEEAVKQIAAIEEALGFADLAQFTAPRPPRS